MEKTSPNSQHSHSQKSQPGSSDPRKGSVPAEGLTAELSSISQRDFLQDAALSVVEFLAKHKIFVGAFVLLGVIGFSGWTAMDALRSRSELKAQTALFDLEKKYSEKKEQFDQARFAELAGQKQEGLTKPSGDLAKDFGSLIDDLEAFAKNNPGTAAGAQAAMMAAETRIAYNQADRASETLNAIAKDTKTSTLVGALMRMATGNTLASAGKCDQAVKAWEDILSTKSAAFLHGEAALRAGMCLEKSGDKAKATEMYRKASAESERSSTAQTAKALLRAIEMGS